MSYSGGGAIEDGVGGTAIAPVAGGEEGGGSTSIVNNNKFTAVDNNLSNPQAAQNQLQPPAVAMAAVNGFNPQQLAMMQQMMALQQAGMLPQMMGMMGMSGVAAGGDGGTASAPTARSNSAATSAASAASAAAPTPFIRWPQLVGIMAKR